jgi:hypothetical protein
MNDKLLDALFARRKEAVTRLAFCLFVSALLCVASRIPNLFVSLPAAWISGGLSVAFIWVFGPPVLIVLQAYALHGLSEAEQLRRLLSSQSLIDTDSTLAVGRQLGEELAPIWRKDFPPIIHLVLAAVLLAPTVTSGVLFSSYLNLARPENGKARYQSRTAQIVDALVGKGGWSGFLPIAPSLQDNLRILKDRATNPEEKAKYQSLAEEIPWTYFPIQTWAYLILLVLSLDGAIMGRAYMTGASFDQVSLLYRMLHYLSSKRHVIGKVWAKKTDSKNKASSVAGGKNARRRNE